MKRPIRLRSVAEEDVAACAKSLQSESVEAAIRFLDAFDAALSLVERSPGIGGACRFTNPLLEGIRVWPIADFKKYLIFYRELADEIEVLRVIHGARDLKAIFGESPR